MASLPSSSTPDERLVLFFDIDNCLYSRNFKIHDRMQLLIHDYFEHHLSLDRADAITLHKRYYKDYGLALDGLIRHHKIDALEYNTEVDDALPLEDILKPDPELRILLEKVDKSKVKMWLFTNAYVNHGRRVVRLLGLDDLFEGITYCDYAEEKLVCKPKEEAFLKAMKEASVKDKSKCFFVDDSPSNCKGATEFGWTRTAHFVEEGLPEPAVKASKFQIRNLKELPTVFPELFKPE
ncbi:hypothetical protein TWF225_005079 [Orbilia oligospora]|nr:hypothetical protein TWF225_005079 [Orbilia oligospora]KAF3251533.1 hypothetical protein TWF128_007205 [Orbilia oligospora]KAF3256840.1 hypothetical protein TWF217_006161 [Orbilia oligospora]KAF3296853.1 hypothetical protein TWF132_009353 [Orbilia oligospora]